MHDPACLDHTDFEELLAHSHLLDPIREVRLRAVNNRIQLWPERFDRNEQHYREQAGIIAMSSHEQAHRFCNCGFARSACNVWKLCEYCAWRRKMELQKKFLSVFDEGRCFSSTIAFDGFLWMNPLSPDPIANYWAAGVHGIRHMVDAGYFQGAVWSEELHIDSFTTGNVHPHVHVVLIAEQVTEEVIAELRARVAAFVPNYGGRVQRRVSTCTRQIQNQYHWANALSYLCKPIKLWQPYQADFEDAVAWGRDAVAFLNQDVDEVLAGFAIHAHRRRQIDYKGVLDARSRTRFIGVPRARRNRCLHYEYTAELLKDLNFEHLLNPGGEDAEQMPIEGQMLPALDFAGA
jgi:hypothetical protein